MPRRLLRRMDETEALTVGNRRMTLTVAFNYGGRTELVDAVVERLRDPNLAADEGRVGRRRAEQFHDVRTANDRIVALYGEILGRPVDHAGSAETAALHLTP